MEEYDDGPVGGGSAYELPSAEVDTLSSTSYETVAPTIRPTLSNASPPNHVTRPKTVTVPPVPITTTTMTTTTRRPPTLAPAPAARPKGSPLTTFLAEGPQSDDLACPRREDIHPCQCIEIPSRIPGDVETVATCKNIRNHQVLSDALKGFQHYRINFFVLDSCKLPPFPNGLFHNVNVEWMEVLNSTVQFQRNFFTCSKDCL
ncbi:hypothetical protein V5799_024537 [Amblyomma americanum]|uniref:Uncharacterized protein n=1 Tax=Amblyomma americanum TaxID=6943 RepID=A0AAQ4EBS3_AMBAM